MAPPVCGCDGTTYDQDCNAVDGVDAQLNAFMCEPPTGYMTCGDRYCHVGTQYCALQHSLGPTSYSCRPLPDECDLLNPSCDCFSREKIDTICVVGGDCTETNGSITITCFG